MTFNLNSTTTVFRNYKDFTVHQYESGADTFYTNAFIVETSKSLVVIDTMMTISEAIGLRTYAKSLGKPIVAVLITHSHPDHYNGVGRITEEVYTIPVITTLAVNVAIQKGIDYKELKWRPVFGSEWPQSKFAATQFVVAGEVLHFDDVVFELVELGEGESDCDTCWIVGAGQRAVFVGDIVFNGTHSFMNDGHSGQWLQSLTQLESYLKPNDTIYTGHGQPGRSIELISLQRHYLEHYRKEIRRLTRGEPLLDDKSKVALVREMNAYLGSDKLAVFVTAGADAVAKELAEHRQSLEESFLKFQR